MRQLILLAAVTLLPWAPSSAAEGLRLGQLQFSPCELGRPGTATTTRALCATLDVPEDWSQPAGRQITLKIGLIATEAARPAADPMLFLAGGPGQSATESWAQIAPAFGRLARKRHVVLVDQRGTGGSHPLACEWPDFEKTEIQSDPETQKSMARECLAKLDADVRFYSTNDAVQDLEAVRKALGGVSYNLVGGSYGTRVAQVYLRRYPDAVRSVILDGVVPNELILGSEHSINLEATLKAIFEACKLDANCTKRFGDPYATLYRLRDRLRAQPAKISIADPLDFSSDEHELSADTLAGVVRMYAYAPQTAALLPLLLDEADQGRGGPLLAQGELMLKNIIEAIMHGMQLSVICSEDAPFMQVRAEDKDLILGNALPGLTLAQCEVWPHRAVGTDFHAPLVSDKPILLLSGELDPVTPPRYGEQVVKNLTRAKHIVVRGQGHIVLNKGCMPRLAAQFVDKLDPKALDTDCLKPLGPTPAFLNFNGAEP